jgi:hypothetical protein
MGAFLITTVVMGWERFFRRRLAGAPVAVSSSAWIRFPLAALNGLGSRSFPAAG